MDGFSEASGYLANVWNFGKCLRPGGRLFEIYEKWNTGTLSEYHSDGIPVFTPIEFLQPQEQKLGAPILLRTLRKGGIPRT